MTHPFVGKVVRVEWQDPEREWHRWHWHRFRLEAWLDGWAVLQGLDQDGAYGVTAHYTGGPISVPISDIASLELETTE